MFSMPGAFQRNVIILAVLSLFASGLFFVVVFSQKNCRVEATPSQEDVRVCIDAVHKTRWKLRISGWAFRPGTDADMLRSFVVLKNEQDCFVLNTRVVVRGDLTHTFAAEEKKAYEQGPKPTQLNPIVKNVRYALNSTYLLDGGRIFYDRSGFEAVGFMPLLKHGRYNVFIAYKHEQTTSLHDTGVQVAL